MVFSDESVEDPIDSWEIFDLIRDINDPEHPYTLEQLNVVQEELIKVFIDEEETFVKVCMEIVVFRVKTMEISRNKLKISENSMFLTRKMCFLAKIELFCFFSMNFLFLVTMSSFWYENIEKQ